MSRREFQLIDGTSQKFWSIELDGTAHTVRFGRFGTAGQSQRKEFANTAEAKTSYDKLIAEKLKKGYAETAGATAAAAKPVDGATRPAVPEPARAETVGKGKGAATSASEPASTPPAVEAAPVALSTARVIELDPDDWLWATWRPRTPRPRPEPTPFDVDECLRRLATVTCRRVGSVVWEWRRGEGPPARQRLIGETREGWVWDWTNVGLAPTMTREEAQFWFVAMTEINNDLKPEQLVARVDDARKTVGSAISTTEALRRLKSSSRFLSDAIVIPLLTLFSPGEWLDLLQKTIDWDEFQSFDVFHWPDRRGPTPCPAAPHGGGAPNDRGRPSTDARHSLTPA